MLEDDTGSAWLSEAADDPPPVGARLIGPSLSGLIAAALPAEWTWLANGVFVHAEGGRIEVRCSAAKLSWTTGKPCGAKWDIAEREDASPAIYVLGHHPVWDETARRDPSTWRLFVIAARLLPPQTTLSLPAAAALTKPIGLTDLAETVERTGRLYRQR